MADVKNIIRNVRRHYIDRIDDRYLPCSAEEAERRQEGKTLGGLLELLIDDESTEFIAKNTMFSICQLVYDKMLESNDSPACSLWKSLEENAAKAAVSFYEGRGIRDSVKQKIYGMKPELLSLGISKAAKRRHLAFHEDETAESIARLAKYFSGSKKPDTIIGIASGAIEPALLLKAYMSPKHTEFIRYSSFRKDYHVKVPKILEDKIEKSISGKKVLIIDDWVATGVTLDKAAAYAKSLKPSAVYATGVVIDYYIKRTIGAKKDFMCSGHPVFEY